MTGLPLFYQCQVGNRLRLCLRHRDDGHIGLVAQFLLERDNAVDQGEQGVVFTHTYVLTRIVDGTSLADEDIAGFADLTTEQFDAQTFACGFTAVLGTTYTFFVCHNSFFFKWLVKQCLRSGVSSDTGGDRSSSDSLYGVSS